MVWEPVGLAVGEVCHWHQRPWSRLRTAASLPCRLVFRTRCGMACVLLHKLQQKLPSHQKPVWEVFLPVLRLGQRQRRRQPQGVCFTSRLFLLRRSHPPPCLSI